MKGIKNVQQGFTLLELLVVVLIIGILASIALPQYEKSVEKARLAEVLINVKALEGSIDRYLLKNGFPSEYVYGQDLLDIELSGGDWDEDDASMYDTDKISYNVSCGTDDCSILVSNNDRGSSAILEVFNNRGGKNRNCYTMGIDKGRFICKYLEPLGWRYIDDEY